MRQQATTGLIVALCLLASSLVACQENVCDEGGNCKSGSMVVGPKQVAIIGGGIGGSSTAYYISQLIPEAEISIYEKDALVCGRITDALINGKQVEVGGSIYHESNANVDGFVHKFNLTRRSPFGGATMGIWNGQEFIYTPSSIPIFGEFVDIARMFYRYGMAPYNLKAFLNNLMSNWSRLYDFEEPSETVGDFFSRLGLYEEVVTLGSEFLESHGISRDFIKEILGPMTRVNYNTDVDVMNAFGVAVAALGSSGEIFSVEEGNKMICSNLVSHSKARSRYGSKVLSITRDINAATPKFTVETEQGKTVYDAVVIATPLELAGIKFENVEVDDFVFHAREYRLVHVTFVAGVLNPIYFNVEGAVPTVVFTIEEPSIPFSSIGRSKNITLPDGRPVSKVFSREELTDDLIEKIFINGSVVLKKPIHAYPILRPPQKFVPFKLSENLYYVNAMETVVSTIETETISAKNVARLLAKSWGLPYTQKL